MGTEIFQFRLLGAKKMGFKNGNPTSKSITKSHFLRPRFILRWWELKHPCLPCEYFVFLKFILSAMILLWKRDRYSSGKGVSLLNMPKKTVPEKVWFGHAFRYRVTNFKPNFLSPQKSKLKNFSAHQQEDFLRISKLTLLLFLVPILKELWQFETWGHFFGTPCTI